MLLGYYIWEEVLCANKSVYVKKIDISQFQGDLMNDVKPS